MMLFVKCVSFVVFKQRKKRAGFTLFEFAVVVAILAVLAAVLMQRIAYYQQEAARVAMQTTVANLRTVLAMKVADLYLKKREVDAAGLEDGNPVSLLAGPPPAYRGEFYAPGPENLAAGDWYFDRTTKNLVYVFTQSKTFGKVASERIYFKVKLRYLPTTSAKSGATSEPKVDVSLIQVSG